ncbi:Copia protein [Trachymyrmex cornetzi]|uniref:Copia protein n=1 Tax=Trachymyrmex cornetzi TaxID=471704 RepID=A0A151J2M5_9HYME|nr:Copia protein [Trachymyrmex cornetzi]KYN17300.1 Copia protein [Trachymyrmex cornetzi]
MSEFIDLKNVTKFSGANFQAWKFQMNAIFMANDILNIVTGTEPMPTEDAAMKIWIKKDAKAMFILSSSMDPGQLEHLLTCKSSNDMWKKLTVLHEQRSESSKLILMTKFHDYRMSANDSVAKHIAKVENMARQLTDLNENISDITIMAKILGSLPSKYNAFVTAWDSVDTDKQTLENLTTRLLKEESRMTAWMKLQVL